MIQELERKRYKKNAPNKYHVDCSYYEKNTDYELQNMFSRINTDLRTKTGDVVRMKNHNKIMQFIENNIEKKGKMENTLKLIDKIMMTDFEMIENPLSKLVYDPTRWG